MFIEPDKNFFDKEPKRGFSHTVGISYRDDFLSGESTEIIKKWIFELRETFNLSNLIGSPFSEFLIISNKTPEHFSKTRIEKLTFLYQSVQGQLLAFSELRKIDDSDDASSDTIDNVFSSWKILSERLKTFFDCYTEIVTETLERLSEEDYSTIEERELFSENIEKDVVELKNQLIKNFEKLKAAVFLSSLFCSDLRSKESFNIKNFLTILNLPSSNLQLPEENFINTTIPFYLISSCMNKVMEAFQAESSIISLNVSNKLSFSQLFSILEENECAFEDSIFSDIYIEGINHKKPQITLQQDASIVLSWKIPSSLFSFWQKQIYSFQEKISACSKLWEELGGKIYLHLDDDVIKTIIENPKAEVTKPTFFIIDIPKKEDEPHGPISFYLRETDFADKVTAYINAADFQTKDSRKELLRSLKTIRYINSRKTLLDFSILAFNDSSKASEGIVLRFKDRLSVPSESLVILCKEIISDSAFIHDLITLVNNTPIRKLNFYFDNKWPPSRRVDFISKQFNLVKNFQKEVCSLSLSSNGPLFLDYEVFSNPLEPLIGKCCITDSDKTVIGFLLYNLNSDVVIFKKISDQNLIKEIKEKLKSATLEIRDSRYQGSYFYPSLSDAYFLNLFFYNLRSEGIILTDRTQFVLYCKVFDMQKKNNFDMGEFLAFANAVFFHPEQAIISRNDNEIVIDFFNK